MPNYVNVFREYDAKSIIALHGVQIPPAHLTCVVKSVSFFHEGHRLVKGATKECNNKMIRWFKCESESCSWKAKFIRPQNASSTRDPWSLCPCESSLEHSPDCRPQTNEEGQTFLNQRAILRNCISLQNHLNKAENNGATKREVATFLKQSKNLDITGMTKSTYSDAKGDIIAFNGVIAQDEEMLNLIPNQSSRTEPTAYSTTSQSSDSNIRSIEDTGPRTHQDERIDTLTSPNDDDTFSRILKQMFATTSSMASPMDETIDIEDWMDLSRNDSRLQSMPQSDANLDPSLVPAVVFVRPSPMFPQYDQQILFQDSLANGVSMSDSSEHSSFLEVNSNVFENYDTGDIEATEITVNITVNGAQMSASSDEEDTIDHSDTEDSDTDDEPGCDNIPEDSSDDNDSAPGSGSSSPQDHDTNDDADNHDNRETQHDGSNDENQGSNDDSFGNSSGDEESSSGLFDTYYRCHDLKQDQYFPVQARALSSSARYTQESAENISVIVSNTDKLLNGSKTHTCSSGLSASTSWETSLLASRQSCHDTAKAANDVATKLFPRKANTSFVDSTRDISSDIVWSPHESRLGEAVHLAAAVPFVDSKTILTALRRKHDPAGQMVPVASIVPKPTVRFLIPEIDFVPGYDLSPKPLCKANSETLDPTIDSGMMLTVFQSAPLVYQDEIGKTKSFNQLNIAAEHLYLAAAFRDTPFYPTFDYSTVDRLRGFLSEGRNSVLHYSGHCERNAYQNCSEYSHLEIEDGWGKMHKLASKDLARWIQKGQSSLQLVFVSSCHSRAIGEAFVKAGIKQVVCCQVDINDAINDMAVEFTKAFYSALSSGATISEAFRQGRFQARLNTQEARQESEKFVLLPQSEMHDVSIISHGGPMIKQPSEVKAPRFTVPKLPDDFVGREVEIHKILLGIQENRITRITGPAGIGKCSVVKHACKYLKDRRHLFMDEITDLVWLDVSQETEDIDFSPLLIHGSSDRDFTRLREPFLKILHASKKLLIIDAREAASVDKLEHFEEMLRDIIPFTNSKVIIIERVDHAGETHLVSSVSETEVRIKPLDFKATVVLFGKLCPHVTTGRNEAVKCSQDLESFISPEDTALEAINTKTWRTLFHRFGGGHPSLIREKATSISCKAYDELLLLGSDYDRLRKWKRTLRVHSRIELDKVICETQTRKADADLAQDRDGTHLYKWQLEELLSLKEDFPTLRSLAEEAKAIHIVHQLAMQDEHHLKACETKGKLESLNAKIQNEMKSRREQTLLDLGSANDILSSIQSLRGKLNKALLENKWQEARDIRQKLAVETERLEMNEPPEGQNTQGDKRLKEYSKALNEAMDQAADCNIDNLEALHKNLLAVDATNADFPCYHDHQQVSQEAHDGSRYKLLESEVRRNGDLSLEKPTEGAFCAVNLDLSKLVDCSNRSVRLAADAYENLAHAPLAATIVNDDYEDLAHAQLAATSINDNAAQLDAFISACAYAYMTRHAIVADQVARESVARETSRMNPFRKSMRKARTFFRRKGKGT